MRPEGTEERRAAAERVTRYEGGRRRPVEAAQARQTGLSSLGVTCYLVRMNTRVNLNKLYNY